jgi:hypothetical protein
MAKHKSKNKGGAGRRDAEQIAQGVPEVPDLSPLGGRTELMPQHSRTELTDGLRSGGCIEYVNGRPFWDGLDGSQLGPQRGLSPAMRGAGRPGGHGGGRVGFRAAPGYLPGDDFYADTTPPGDYSVTVPDVTEDNAPEARETGRHVVRQRDHF